MATPRRIIEIARQHLSNGNTDGYRRIMESAIRSAMSDRSAQAFRDAMAQDLHGVTA